MGLEADLQSCAGIVQKADPDRFAAVMAAPVALRDRLFPLHAFAVEVARAPWVTQEAMIAEMRLQWWRDALAEIAAGGPVRRHEVVTPLASVLTPEMARALDGAIEVRRWDIYREPFEDAAHLRDYLHQTGGVFYRVVAQTIGGNAAGAEEIGFAVAVANWLRAVPELERRGRVPLLDGRAEGVRALAEQGLDALKQGRRAGPDALTRKALLPGWQAEVLLRHAVSQPGRVAEGSLGQSEGRKKASLLWKALSGWI